jgi:hypothetical protein
MVIGKVPFAAFVPGAPCLASPGAATLDRSLAFGGGVAERNLPRTVSCMRVRLLPRRFG